MDDVWPIVLMGIGGLLVGGAWSMFKQGNKIGAVVVSILAVLALGGAVLWWWPQ